MCEQDPDLGMDESELTQGMSLDHRRILDGVLVRGQGTCVCDAVGDNGHAKLE